MREPDLPQEPEGRVRELRRPLAISLDQAEEIAARVQELINAGRARSAWELIRHLHPADMGSIVVGLPRTSRDAMIQVMSPDTVAWMLRQMNPVQAARVGTRLGSRMLTFVLGQLRPHQAIATLRRLPIRRAHEVAESLEQPLDETEFLDYEADTAGSLMVEQVPSAHIDGMAESARDSLRTFDEIGYKLTHLFVTGDGDALVGQISMVDLALADNDTPIRAITSSLVATVTVDTPAEECARLQRHYNLTQLPVVDGDKILGVILAESLLGATVEQDTRQMQQVANVAGETVDGPLTSSVRTRLALAHGESLHHVPRRRHRRALRVDPGKGRRARRLPARRRGAGRDWRHSDPHPHRSGNGPRRARRCRRTASAGARGRPGHPAWHLAGSPGRGHRHPLETERRLGTGARRGDVRQHGHRGLRRRGSAAVPAAGGLDPAVASAVVVTTVTDVFGFLLFLGIASASISLIL